MPWWGDIHGLWDNDLGSVSAENGQCRILYGEGNDDGHLEELNTLFNVMFSIDGNCWILDFGFCS